MYWAREIVYLREVHVADLVGVVVIGYLSAGPVESFQPHALAGVRFDDGRNVRVPPIERVRSRLFVWRTIDINLELRFWHYDHIIG